VNLLRRGWSTPLSKTLCVVCAVACWPLSSLSLAQQSTTPLPALATTASTASQAAVTSLLGQAPSLVADVAERVAPSVVNIDVTQQAPSAVSANPLQEGLPFSDELLRRFFGLQPQDMQPNPARPPRTVTGNGSGVIIDTQGHILTNYHVVNRASSLTVTLHDGRQLAAKVMGKDRLTDLAIVKVEAPNLIPATLGVSQRLRPGDWVLAIGSPLGFDHTVTLGIVSALSRNVPDLNNNVQFIQTDAAINPGNSGGPLVNLQGEVIGINTAISGTAQNIGFAIPVDTVKQISQALLTQGQVKRPWVGLGLGTLTPNLKQALGLPAQTEGVLVSQVAPNSPSAQAGLQQGDVIQRVNGQKLTDAKALQDKVRNHPINQPLHLQLLRDGQVVAVTVTTVWMPTDEVTPVVPPVKPAR
jgi:Do/DeqQ family serine protease